jgi:hypothetical protein
MDNRKKLPYFLLVQIPTELFLPVLINQKGINNKIFIVSTRRQYNLVRTFKKRNAGGGFSTPKGRDTVL